MSNNTNTIDSGDYLRHAGLAEIVAELNNQRSRSIDLVAPVSRLTMRAGGFVVTGMEPILGEDGVTEVNGVYRPTTVGDEGLASALDIPVKYLRRLRSTNVELLDANVNSWLRHAAYEGKSYLLRCMVDAKGDPGTDGYDGVVRAFLSDRYKTIDNIDVLMAALQGLADGGVEQPIITADLTQRRMVVRVTAPGIALYAPALLSGYRNPFDDGARPLNDFWTPERVARAAGIEGMGYAPGTEPVLFAGFKLSNSETGNGAMSITPELMVRVCKNGLTITANALREIHLGGKLDEGTVQWSEDTKAANTVLVRRQVTDVVGKFLNRGYVERVTRDLERKAGVEVKPSDAPEVIETVAKSTRWTQDEQKSILDMFLQGGQFTAGGIMQAVSAAAQTLPGDAAYDLEAQAVSVLDRVGAVANR